MVLQLSITSVFAAAPITNGLLVSLDVNASTISGTTASASDGTTATGTLQASGMYVSPNNFITFGDSTNQYIDYGDIGSTAGDISLEMWVNISTMHTSNWNILASKWFNGTFGSDWHFGYYQSKLRLCYNGACPAAGMETTNRGTGWNHVAFTIRQPASGTCPGTGNGTVTLYVNGVQVAQDVSTGACHPTSSNHLFVIGDKRATATLGIDGKVSKFRFYTRALTSAELATIFRAEASTFSLSAAPYNTALPSFTGIGKVANVQSGSVGTWSNTPTSYTYKWFRSSTENGSYTFITGATALNYTPVSADASKYLKLEVTAINSSGSIVETSTARSISEATPALAISGAPTTAPTKTVINLSIAPGYAGRVTFFESGKRIPRCINLASNSGNSYSVTCPWQSGNIGTRDVKAVFTSSDSGASSGSSPVTKIFISKRTTRR